MVKALASRASKAALMPGRLVGSFPHGDVIMTGDQKKPQPEYAASFWSWFVANKARLASIADGGEAVLDECLAQLQRIDNRLYFELSTSQPLKEFVVTAQGAAELFPLVDEVVACSPDEHDWEFIGLKPPAGFDFVTSYEGVEFDPTHMWFDPLENSKEPSQIGLRVFIESACFDLCDGRDAAVRVVLETGLGERVFAERIGYVDTHELPPDPEAAGLIGLDRLPHYLSWWLARQ